jgi:multidrug efflux pump subunit AcrA (membrane-fusion protein)
MTNIVGIVDTQSRPSLSFVVPVKDEEATLETLFRGIAAQATNLTSHWEVIFIDDGSSDGSWRVIRQLAAEDEEHVKAIRFRRNAGKAEALAAGWKECTGDFVFTMDADLQDDPEEIPRFLEKMREGFDVVTGWKRTRHDPWHKVLPSRIFNFILSRVNKVELHDHNCGFKCYRAEVVKSLPMYGEMHRMVPSLAAMHGFRTAEIPVKHHPRRHGRSKYGLQRFLRGFLDMWTVHFLQNFRQRPMHLMGSVSLLMLVGACCLALFLAGVPVRRSVFLLLSSALPALLIGAVLTIMLGFLAEWNVHQSVEVTHFRPIAETIGLAGRSSVFQFSVDRQPASAEPSLGATDEIVMKRRVYTKNRVLRSTVIATGLIFAGGAFVLWPAYINPVSRLYTLAIGFLNVQRFLGMPMEAEAGHPVLHDFETPVLGEGTIQCTFYNVPVVPTARVNALYVEEGDEVKEGQLLAELNETEATLNLNSAQLGVASAKAEQQRVEAGSVNTLVAERPEKDRVSLEGLAKVVKEAKAKVEMYQKLNASGAASRLELVNAEIELANAQTSYAEAEVSSGMSTQGFPQSKEIAQNAINDAQNLVQQREEALKYYRVTAPAEGVIDRVLIRDGEYNQNAGNTGFIIASGMWFEANLDQRAVTDLCEGMQATVNLEAYAGRSFRATVERVIPIVTFNAGGPETTSPVRPLGTGSPEWPATFKVRLHLDSPGVKLTPGMTGFARVVVRHRRALAVPRNALSSLSAGKGVVRVVDNADRPVTTPVSLGEVDARFVEITGGVDTSNWVLTDNSRFLRDNDKIHITRLTASQQAAKYGELAASQPDALKSQPKDIQANAEQAQKNDELTAGQRDALQARLKDIETKAEQARKNGELTASQRDALQAQLKDIETKAQRAQKNAELAATQRDALQAQLKDTQAKAEQVRKDRELTASQRDALQAQLKDTQAKAEQARKNGELAASQRDALQAQLKDTQAKAEQARKNGELAANQRDALQAQLRDIETKAEQARKNGELAASQRDALQAQLRDTQAKAEQAQKNDELTASQRDALLAQLKDTQVKADQARKNGELAASQRDALQAQLKDIETKAERARQNGELKASQRDALLAQLKDTQVKADQARKNGELAASQRDALQAQLKDIETKAQQAQKNAELAASQRDGLQAELKNTQAKADQAQKNAVLAQVQPDTGTGSAGETTQNLIASDPTIKIDSATQDDQASDLPPSRSVRASSESKKGRHVVKHRTAGRRENGSLRAIDHWLRRHLPLAVD